MSRVKRGVTARKRHKKILKKAKGYYGSRSRTFRSAKQSVIKASQYSYRDRKVRKRMFRRNWIVVLNAALIENGITYSKFINKIKINNIKINRKNLANMAINNDKLFDTFVNKIVNLDK